MHLNPTQVAALKNELLTDPAARGYAPHIASGSIGSLVLLLNANAVPTFIVWKTMVINDAIGDAMNGSEIAGLSSLNMQRLQVLAAYSGGTQNPSRFDRRDAFDRVFSSAGGVITRAALLALWKRPATQFERLYATGTGSDATPAQLVIQGEVDVDHVIEALRS